MQVLPSSTHLASALSQHRSAVRRCPAAQAVSTGRNGSQPTVVTPIAVTTTPSKPVVLVKYDVSLFDALKFNGPAPELINGRLAMIGIVAAALEESKTGHTVLYQLQHIEPATIAVVLLWVYASMVPVLKGAKNEPFGWFTPRAETTNGRAAMLGFAVLMLLEYKAGVPFF